MNLNHLPPGYRVHYPAHETIFTGFGRVLERVVWEDRTEYKVDGTPVTAAQWESAKWR